MSVLGGLVGAAIASIVMAIILVPATNNLTGVTREVALAALLVFSFLLGLITGSAVGRRARFAGGRVRLFSALAGAVCGGLLGAATFFGLTAAYVRDYAIWPSNVVDVVVAVVSLPVLAALGLCVGSAAGFAVGGVTGVTLAIVVPKRRQ